MQQVSILQRNIKIVTLFKRRRELSQIAQREQSGESFWTNQFEAPVKNKILIAFLEASGHNVVFQQRARGILLKDMGAFYLLDHQLQAYDDFQRYFVSSEGEDFVDAVEACQLALSDHSLRYSYGINLPYQDSFAIEVNRILAEHRISYQLIGDVMIEHKSQVMFANIVEPVLIHTANIEQLSGVNKSFRDALDELSKGKYADAITDASRALEETLRYLGAEGTGTTGLFRSAVRKDLVKPHDQKLFDSIFSAVSWVGAQRTNEGDAHNHTEPSTSEAWATVHICGALILKFLKLPN